jgi:hypothetical protein
MAYTLKTSGLATSLISCLAVDSDGTVKDFAAPAVACSWVDAADAAASPDVGSAQWRAATSNSSLHRYFTTGSNKFIKFGATKPVIELGGARSVVIACRNPARNVTVASYLMAAASVPPRLGATAYGYWLYQQDYGKSIGGTDAPLYLDATNTGQHLISFCMNGVTAGAIYKNATAGASPGLGLNATPAAMAPGYIGRGDAAAASYLAGDWFMIACFNTYLSAGDVSALNDDWFGTLFDVGAVTTRKLKCLVEPAAIGSTVRYGAVFEAPTGAAGSKVTGPKIGEFESVAFQTGSGADTGYAVLKVPVADFGGGALSTSDTPVVYLEDVDESTYPFPATVIDE